MNIKETVEKYYLVKQRQKELQTKLDKYKEIIENHMKSEGIKKMEVNEYIVKKTQVKNERINKKGCPVDIWEQYSVSSTYTSIDINKKDENKKEKKPKDKIRKSV
jgi:hypothetical protein